MVFGALLPKDEWLNFGSKSANSKCHGCPLFKNVLGRKMNGPRMNGLTFDQDQLTRNFTNVPPKLFQ